MEEIGSVGIKAMRAVAKHVVDFETVEAALPAMRRRAGIFAHPPTWGRPNWCRLRTMAARWLIQLQRW